MKKKIILLISLLVIGIVLLTGCTQKTLSEQPPSTISQELIIKTGTSFGMCLGYCQQDITITKDKIVIHKSGRNQDGPLPEVTEDIPISSEQWDTLISSLKIDEFNSLDDRIGCPDCADGGAEWIEIIDGDTTKRVTFEYSDTISQIENFVIEIRKIRDAIFSQYKD